MATESAIVSVLIPAVGGQGGGVLSEWIVDAALEHGLRVHGTSIPGVAQRTGSTTYYVELYTPRPTPRSRRSRSIRCPAPSTSWSRRSSSRWGA